jgi:hypothetical protein
MSNFVPSKSFRPSPQPPHVFTLGLPIPTNEKVIPLLWAEEDTGKFVKGILKHRDQLLGKRVLGAAGYYSMEDMIQDFQEVKLEAGKGARAVQLTPEMYRGMLSQAGLPAFAVEELSENFEMLAQCGYFDKANVEDHHAVSAFLCQNPLWTLKLIIAQILDEPVTTWREFIAQSKDFADLK